MNSGKVSKFLYHYSQIILLSYQSFHDFSYPYKNTCIKFVFQRSDKCSIKTIIKLLNSFLRNMRSWLTQVIRHFSTFSFRYSKQQEDTLQIYFEKGHTKDKFHVFHNKYEAIK